MPRVLTYNAQIAEEICEWIAAGKPLRQFCLADDRPARSVVYEWIQKFPEFAASMEQARMVGADEIAEEALTIIDTEPEVVQTQAGSSRDSAHVKWLQNRAEFRLKLLAKWHPKRYGDKLGIGQADGMGPVTLALNGSDVDG